MKAPLRVPTSTRTPAIYVPSSLCPGVRGPRLGADGCCCHLSVRIDEPIPPKSSVRAAVLAPVTLLVRYAQVTLPARRALEVDNATQSREPGAGLGMLNDRDHPPI